MAEVAHGDQAVGALVTRSGVVRPAPPGQDELRPLVARAAAPSWSGGGRSDQHGETACRTALSFIPGGLGSTEAVMGGSLILLGVEPGTAVAATLVCRLVTLWPAVAIGLGFLLALEGSALGGTDLPSRSEAPLAATEARESGD